MSFIPKILRWQFGKEENDKKETETMRYHNNHAAHTDSGLLTVVVTTDMPGLELVDQKEKKWIAIEQLIHKYVQQQSGCTPFAHRRYAVVFWSDSIDYLLSGKDLRHRPVSCLHRVERCDTGRYSVVFKQRTTPLKTACR